MKLRQLRDRLIADPDDAVVLSNFLDLTTRNEDSERTLDQLRYLFPEDLTNPRVFENLGLAFGEAGQLVLALWAFQRVLITVPDNLDALYNYGETQRRLGDLDAAVAAFEKIVKGDIGHGEAWAGLANLRAVSGDLDAAKSAYEASLAADRGSAIIYNNYGVVLRQLGDAIGAAEGFRKAIALDPGYATAFDNLGNALVDAGDLVAAITAFETAIKLKPGYYDAQYNLGNVHRAQGDWDSAIGCYEAALRNRPDHQEARSHLGQALQHLGRYTLAAELFQEILINSPDDSLALGNLANVFRDLGRFEEAERLFDQALDINPDDIRLMGNQGLAMLQAGRCDDAIACYEKALTSLPEDVLLHNNLAHAHLLAGNFAEGWREFEWRRRDPELASLFAGLPGKEWTGGPLIGKSILVRCEQGFGDTIQFCRYFELLADQGASVTVSCPRRLTRMLRDVGGIANIIPGDSPFPPSDYWVALLSLPRLFETEVDGVSAQNSYISAEPELVAKWKAKTGQDEVFKVGIGWQGNPDYEADRARSVPLKELTPLFRQPNVQFYSLQCGYGAEQLTAVAGTERVFDFTPEMDTDDGFVDTAGLIANLDLVVSSDTSTPHLAAALGRPVWMLTAFAPDWRWMLDRVDSPWYPTMRLARQPKPGDWASVVSKLAAALERCVGESDNPLSAFDAIMLGH